MTAGGGDTTAHYAPHFNAANYCQCSCDDCHMRLTGGCVCPHCPCDDPTDDRHEAGGGDTTGKPASPSGDLATVQVREYAVGVLDRCDDCGRLTVCNAVMDPDDPLGWVVESWVCHPCAVGGDQFQDEPWCPDHGYGCEPSNCPCGHTLRCDCWEIANEH